MTFGFAEQTKWRKAVVDHAEQYQGIAWDNWKAFRNAYRSGAFKALEDANRSNIRERRTK